MIEPCRSVEQSGWLPLRRALWPQSSDAEHLKEMATFLALPERFAQYVAYDEQGQPVGLIEVALRHDHVNGTESSPVAFLEGIYVTPSHRRRGIARGLIAAATEWAVKHGMKEFASDAALDNEASHRMHRALGFVETERVVYFRKWLPPQ
jgi:aminoglycoside 6'-N-acetyltransferase I